MARAVYILMAQMLEQFELPICAFRQDGSAKGFHDLLDCHCLARELVFGRAVGGGGRVSSISARPRT